jgi:hypothetical protein
MENLFLNSGKAGRALTQTFSFFGQLPGRVDAENAAKLLGFSPHDIPILIANGFLKPLADPAPNATKYFATVDIQTLVSDRTWLNRATHCVYEYWKGKNAQKAALKQEAAIAA